MTEEMKELLSKLFDARAKMTEDPLYRDAQGNPIAALVCVYERRLERLREGENEVKLLDLALEADRLSHHTNTHAGRRYLEGRRDAYLHSLQIEMGVNTLPTWVTDKFGWAHV